MRVATLVDSTSAVYLRKIEADVQEFPSTHEMYQAPLDEKVDAVLLGSASFNYYSTHEGRGRVKLVGPDWRRTDRWYRLRYGCQKTLSPT